MKATVLKTGFIALNAVIVLYIVAPIIVVIGSSFTTTGFPTFPPRGFTFRWFQRILTADGFTDAILLSARLAFCTMAVSSVLGVFAALGLGRWKVPGHAAISAFVMLPILFPTTVLGLALLVFFAKGGISGTFFGLVVAHSIIATPFVIRMVLASLGNFNPAVEEAARNLGAGWWRTFFLVTLPLIKPGLLAGAMFAFILSFDELVVTLFLTGPHLETLPVKIFTYLEFNNDPMISAVSTVLIVIWAAVGVPLYWRLLSVKN